MLLKKVRVTWSSKESNVVQDLDELDGLLDHLAAEHDAESPIIVLVERPDGESVYYGVGGDMSFVSSAELPYLTTIGDEPKDGEIDYCFQGHHTAIPRRYLIPADLARRIIHEFVVSGRLAGWHTWKPVGGEAQPEPGATH